MFTANGTLSAVIPACEVHEQTSALHFHIDECLSFRSNNEKTALSVPATFLSSHYYIMDLTLYYILTMADMGTGREDSGGLLCEISTRSAGRPVIEDACWVSEIPPDTYDRRR